MSADLVNGLFELFGSFFLALNVLRLHRDKQVKGVNWMATAFFMAWGYWNLYFYPAVGALLSFYGGVAIVIVNTAWLGQMVYYIRKERHFETQPA